MIDKLAVIGIDSGPTSGLVGLRWALGGSVAPTVVQCDANSLVMVVRAMTNGSWRYSPDVLIHVGIERFVDGNDHDRQLSGPAALTRELVQRLSELLPDMSTRVHLLNAADHKPWARAAGAARLHRSGLWKATEGMRHARDAARIALYTAVDRAGVPDPLSRRSPW